MNACQKIALSLFLVTAVSSAFAAGNDKLEVTFELGYNGVVPKSMRLVPVRVRIRNQLKTLTGRIEVRQPSAARGSEVVLVKNFRSSSPSAQVFTLYPRVETGGIENFSLEVRVVFDDKALQVYKGSVHGKTNKRIVLTVGTGKLFQMNLDRRVRDKPKQALIYATANYQFVPILPLKLPEDVFGYDSVHAIILNGTQFVHLTGRQKETIKQWIRGGGRLLLFHPETSKPLSTWLATMGKTDISRFFMSQVGLGYLIIQPFKSARDLPFWLDDSKEEDRSTFLPEIIIEDVEDGILSTRVPRDSGGFQAFVARLKGSTYGIRGFMWLLAIIVSYLAFVGPVDWLVTKKTGKPWLSWPIFAAVIVLFSCISYWYSGRVQSAPMTIVWNTVIDVPPGGGPSRGEGCFWIRSTGNFDFEVEAGHAGAHLSCRESRAANKSAAASAIVENRLKKPSTINCRIPVFSAKEFNLVWYEEVTDLPQAVSGGFELPDGVEVRKAYLAMRHGLKILEVDEQGRLMDTGRTRKWADVFKSCQKTLITEADEWTADGLEDYWLTIGFSGMRRRKHMALEDGIVTVLNEWERSIDRAAYLQDDNRVLVVFVEKPLSHVSLDKDIPKLVGIDCIRYFLPKPTF